MAPACAPNGDWYCIPGTEPLFSACVSCLSLCQLSLLRGPRVVSTPSLKFRGARHPGPQRVYSAAAHELEAGNQIGLNTQSNTSDAVLDIASAEQWESVLNDPANKEKLIVFMAKAKGCRPCKQFAGKYNTIAEHFVDSVFVTCIGDRNESTRGLMRSMKVRATPTFIFYRGQEKVHEHSGINGQKMLDALEDNVVEGEAGWGERCIHFEGAILSTEEQAEE